MKSLGRLSLLLTFLFVTLFLTDYEKVNANEEVERFDFDMSEFIDQDPDEGEISGFIQFEVNMNDQEIVDSYDLIVGSNYETPIAKISASGKNTYTFIIPENTKLPVTTGTIGVSINYSENHIEEIGDIGGGSREFFDFATTTNLTTININSEEELEAKIEKWYSNDDKSAYQIKVYSKYFREDNRYQIKFQPEDASMAALYFLDENGEKIGRIGQMYLGSHQNSLKYSDTIPMSIPEEAVAIGVFAKNQYGESNNYIGIPLLNLDEDNLRGASTFVDQDQDENQISGTLTWNRLENEDPINKYSVYIVSTDNNEFNNIKASLGEVEATNQDSYSLTIPSDTPFEEKDKLIILPEFTSYFHTGYVYDWFVSFTDRNPDTMQPREFSADEVEVKKANGRIVFEFDNLEEGDMINIYYDPSGNELMGSVSGHLGSISLRPEIEEGIVENIYLSISNVFGEESNIVGFEIGSLFKGWFVDSNFDWVYFNEEGELATGWLREGSTWYYLGNTGVMQTGWIKDGSTWYYLNSGGAMQTGWLKDGSTWYYLNSSGAMQKGWVKSGSGWYYMNSSGAMQKGWIKDGSTWYYLNGSGVMQTGWIQSGGKWYYLYSSGSMAYNTTIGSYKLGTDGAWIR